MGNFVEEKKVVNAQANHKIEIVESTSNKKIEGLQSEMAKKFDNLQYSISRLTNQQQVLEKGKFPSRTQPNPKGVHEIVSSNEPAPRVDEVKAVVTLRSGKHVDQPVPTTAKETKKKKKESEVERIVIKEEHTPPFPQALKGKKRAINQT